MIAYLHYYRTFFILTLCARPCNGEEFAESEKITVTGRRHARQICKARGATPFNF